MDQEAKTLEVSQVFGKRCGETGDLQQVGSLGNCYDSPAAEIFYATVGCEFIDRRICRSQTETGIATFKYVEGWYDSHRRHSRLCYLSPADFEKSYQQAA